jgi:hypothetical protein
MYLFAAALMFTATLAAENPPMPMNSTYNVHDFGASGAAPSDMTAAFQKAIDTAADAGGGIVEVPTGRYRFEGSLNLRPHVTLRGVHAYAPAHAGLRDKSWAKPVFGTVLEPYGGRGEENGTPFITLETNSTLQGVTIHYPAQDPDAEAPTPYPWTIAMRGNNPAVIDVQMLNPFKAIDASKNQRALIRNVHGQPIAIGIFVDVVYDIGRIENVHWNPWWTLNTPVYKWQMENGVGFWFEKTDWHYVVNTFCFGYNVGYKFGESEAGACNGNFLGIGADDCYTALLAEQIAPMGVLITNGEFVSFHGPDPTMIRVGEHHIGSLRFVNCAFWGPSNRNAVIDGHGTVGFSDCTFMQWGAQEDKTLPSIDVLGGSVMIRGCEFKEDKPQIRLGEGVRRAIVSENFFIGEERVENNAKGQVIIKDNLSLPASEKKW